MDVIVSAVPIIDVLAFYISHHPKTHSSCMLKSTNPSQCLYPALPFFAFSIPIPSPSRSIHLPSHNPLQTHSPLILNAGSNTNNSKQFSRSRPALSPTYLHKHANFPNQVPERNEPLRPLHLVRLGCQRQLNYAFRCATPTFRVEADKECCQPPSAAHSHSARLPSGHGSDDSGASEGGSALWKELCGSGCFVGNVVLETRWMKGDCYRVTRME